MNYRAAGLRSQASSQLPFGTNSLLIAASSLILYGVTRGSKAGIALAAAGGALAIAAAKSESTDQQSARTTFLVNATPQAAYELWRDFENLPRFMAHLKSVRTLDKQYSEWVALGPLNKEIRWTAEIVEDRPGQRIAWRSQPDSDITTSGFVDFRPDPQQRGTFVIAEVRYSAAGGAVARGLARLMGRHPEFMVRESVRRFKSLLEAGEAPTTVGQSHGPRGVHGRVERVLFQETSNHPEPQATTEFAHSA